MACKILLVVMLNTIVFLSSTLKFGAENAQLGVIGIKNILYRHTSRTTGVAATTLKCLWTTTTEDSEGTVHIEVPERKEDNAKR